MIFPDNMIRQMCDWVWNTTRCLAARIVLGREFKANFAQFTVIKVKKTNPKQSRSSKLIGIYTFSGYNNNVFITSGLQFLRHQGITRDISKPLLIQTSLWLQPFKIKIPPTKIIEQNLREANNIDLTFRGFFMWDGWKEEDCWTWNLFKMQSIFYRLSRKWR